MSVRFERITRAMDGVKEAWIARLQLDFFAESANGNVDRTGIEETLGAPNGIDQLLAGEGAAGTRGKMTEKAEFEDAGGDGSAGNENLVKIAIDDQAPETQNIARAAGGIGAPEQGTHTSE